MKDQWEKRILDLGGRDYRANAQDKFGDIPKDGSIYQYYGAAKNLIQTDKKDGV